MNRINPDAVADIHFEVNWKSSESVHSEHYEANNVNFYRDCMPEKLIARLDGKTTGDMIQIDFKPGIMVSGHDMRNTFDVKRAQFNRRFKSNGNIVPRVGRFYPKGILENISGIFPQNIQPFRCVGIENNHLVVDFNHPLAKSETHIKGTVKSVCEKTVDRGGSCNDWMELISNGPGMQTRWEKHPTDFFSDTPFKREDETPDDRFYQQPRFVHHIDENAVKLVTDIYGRFLQDDMQVLDLMSSWTSHIPDSVNLKKFTGIGLNQKELDKNTRLTNRIVHDLNQNPALPLETGSYDATICSLSIEYLIHPFEVFNEVARVLKSDGQFIITFSNRWFPPKVTRIWKELHDFERMGVVLEYFLQSGLFKDIQTYSMRGLPRPQHDKYFSENRLSDPIFAIWGSKI
ncbi:MAG: methyltransferase domain-containing protein [Desulfobacterales bacterium]|nr:methyltransferase domain-containing protein [Desulfobacterales bacterium]